MYSRSVTDAVAQPTGFASGTTATALRISTIFTATPASGGTSAAGSAVHAPRSARSGAIGAARSRAIHRASVDHPAAGDDDGLAGDVGGVRRGEEGDDAGDLLG